MGVIGFSPSWRIVHMELFPLTVHVFENGFLVRRCLPSAPSCGWMTRLTMDAVNSTLQCRTHALAGILFGAAPNEMSPYHCSSQSRIQRSKLATHLSRRLKGRESPCSWIQANRPRQNVGRFRLALSERSTSDVPFNQAHLNKLAFFCFKFFFLLPLSS
jgi:hypothetical protein